MFEVLSDDDSCPTDWITVTNKQDEKWDMNQYLRDDKVIRLCYQTETVSNPCDEDGAPRDIKLVKGTTCTTEEIGDGNILEKVGQKQDHFSLPAWRVCAK